MSNLIDTSAPTSPDFPAKKKLPPQDTSPSKQPVTEIGGRTGPEPTRYGDWEKDGKCTDF